MTVLLVLFGLVGIWTEWSAGPPIVTVTGYDYAFTAPDTIRAGTTTFRFVDKGKFDHHFIVFRLDAGVSIGDFHRLMRDGGESPKGIASLGGLQTDKIYSRGSGANASSSAAPSERDLMLDLRPGRYVLACLHAEDGVTHLEKGMMRALTVLASPRRAPRPKFDATITMSDYAYKVSGNLASGTRTIRLTNAGPQEHHVFIQRMRAGKLLADIGTHRAARAKERAAKLPDSMSKLVAPMIPVTAITRMSPGEEAFITLGLIPGHYRLFCLVPDAADGKPHTEHGMDQLIAVARAGQ